MPPVYLIRQAQLEKARPHGYCNNVAEIYSLMRGLFHEAVSAAENCAEKRQGSHEDAPCIVPSPEGSKSW